MKSDGKWGFIDRTGKEFTLLKYDNAEPFSEGMARVNLGGKWGFIDRTGKEITPLKYDYALDFHEGSAGVEMEGRWGRIDKDGNEHSIDKRPVEPAG